ncbi:hypothetical protein [Marinobacter sp. X15-166B]|nr:hypothetical protein [Marinobacter sp. X15-166B]
MSFKNRSVNASKALPHHRDQLIPRMEARIRAQLSQFWLESLER